MDVYQRTIQKMYLEHAQRLQWARRTTHHACIAWAASYGLMAGWPMVIATAFLLLMILAWLVIVVVDKDSCRFAERQMMKRRRRDLELVAFLKANEQEIRSFILRERSKRLA
jgi:hypothetical protein